MITLAVKFFRHLVQNFINFVSLFLLGVGSLANAHIPVDGDIRASFGALTYMTHALDHSFVNGPLVAPGLVAEGDVNSYGGVEISLFYLRNSFSVQKRGMILVERVKRIYISTGYRHWFNRQFSTAAAFSTSSTIGDPTVISSEYTNQDQPETSARDTTEYGVDLSVAMEPWQQDRYALVIDGRYSYSFTPRRDENSNHFGIFVAIKYFIQSRQSELE